MLRPTSGCDHPSVVVALAFLAVIPQGSASSFAFALSQPKLRHLDRSAAQWRDPCIGICLTCASAVHIVGILLRRLAQ